MEAKYSFFDYAALNIQPGKQSKEDMITQNMGLVNMVLRSFKWVYGSNPNINKVFDEDDLRQEGLIGLMKAVDTYDPEKAAFSTHAVAYIKHAMFREYFNKGFTIRKPLQRHEMARKIYKAEEDYMKRKGQEPTLKQLSQLTGLGEGAIEAIRWEFQSIDSLDAYSGDNEENENRYNLIPDDLDYIDGAEKKICLRALRKDLEGLMEKDIASNKERKALRVYMGFYQRATPQSYPYVCKHCKVNKDEAVKLVRKGLVKLKQHQRELSRNYPDLISSIALSSADHGREASVRMARNTVQAIIKVGDCIHITRGDLQIQGTVFEVDSNFFRVKYVSKLSMELDLYEEKFRAFNFREIIEYRTIKGKLAEVTLNWK